MKRVKKWVGGGMLDFGPKITQATPSHPPLNFLREFYPLTLHHFFSHPQSSISSNLLTLDIKLICYVRDS